MSNNPFEVKTPVQAAEVAPVMTKRLGEGQSTGWENERVFTTDEVIASVKGLETEAGDLKVTDQVLTHEGVLVSMSMRAQGSAIGYSYVLKGTHGGTFRARTVIDRIDYAGPASDDLTYAEEIAEYKDGAWVK